MIEVYNILTKIVRLIKIFKVALTPRLEFIYPEDRIPTAHKKVDEDVQDSPLWSASVSKNRQ